LLDAVLDVVTALPLCGLELCSLCVEMTQLVLYGDMLAGQHMQLPVINTNLDICLASVSCKVSRVCCCASSRN
jgi:hypothetical protein